MIHAPIPDVVHRHVEEAAVLRSTRSFLVRGPHVKLHHLRRHDDRLAAHLDGLAVSGEYGSKLAAAALERTGPGETFTAAVRTIEDRDALGLDRLLTLAEASPETQRGVISAFGWVDASSLRGITTKLLESPRPFRRLVGLASCAMHQVDAGAAVTAALSDGDAALRARALCVIADQGQIGLLQACLGVMTDEDARCVFEATRASVLLGDRRAAMETLHAMALEAGPWRSLSLGLFLKLCAPTDTHTLLKALSQESAAMRLLIRSVGVAGDPNYVPWLLQQMQDPALARVAGESFSFIAGIDLANAGLERKPPESFEPGPNDDPEDDDVAMDEDHGLPWPDPEGVSAWWAANSHGFQAGERYFMGALLSSVHCLKVLKSGYQRQRAAAAEYLCLLHPGTRRFPTSAPAWRQQRWLDRMPSA